MTQLLLLSGGLDSTAVAAMTRPERCLTIDYGQIAAEAEVRAATQVARQLGLPTTVLRIPAGEVGAGLMAKGSELHSPDGVSPEWWPFRNQLLVTLAAAWGVTRGVTSILLGSVATDVSRHRDGSEEFRRAIDELVSLQEGGIRVQAPAAELSALELLQASGVPEDVLAWTHSCHRANLPCARCPGCVKRAETLQAAQLLQ